MTEPNQDSSIPRLNQWWARSRAALERLFETYGWIAVGVYFTLFFGTWAAFSVAVAQGFAVQGAVAGAGTIGGAYLATKLTQPFRIAITVVLTPIVAKLVPFRRTRES